MLSPHIEAESSKATNATFFLNWKKILDQKRFPADAKAMIMIWKIEKRWEVGGCALHHVRRVAILYSYNSYIILHYTIYYILYISQWGCIISFCIVLHIWHCALEGWVGVHQRMIDLLLGVPSVQPRQCALLIITDIIIIYNHHHHHHCDHYPHVIIIIKIIIIHHCRSPPVSA